MAKITYVELGGEEHVVDVEPGHSVMSSIEESCSTLSTLPGGRNE